MGLMNAGLFGPIITAPLSLRQELLKRFGLSGFTDQNNVHFERAERENSQIVAGMIEGIMTVSTPISPESQIIMDDPLFKYDDDDIHYEVHRHLILSQEFADLDPRVQAALIIHTDVHHLRMEAKKAQEAMAQMGPQGPPGGPQPPSGPEAPPGRRPEPGLEPPGGPAAPPAPMM